MSTVEALEFAIDLLRQKAEMDRGAVRIMEMAPAQAQPHLDRHAVTRFKRCQDAIEILSTLKRSQEVPNAM